MLNITKGKYHNMPIRITIDTREGKLYDILKKTIGRLEDIEFVVAPLEIGDVEILHTDPDFRVVIERKTERDLGASLKDGRYHEQKARILATIPSQHCMYIIENPHSVWEQNMYAACSASAYAGAIIHTMFRDGMHVVITKNTEETCRWIETIFQKCKDNPHKFMINSHTGENGVGASYISCAKIKTKKLDNVDPVTCFLLQLGQIPGISSKLAQSIAEVYPNWRALICAIDNAYESGGTKNVVSMLSKIPLIGAKKAEVIFEYLRNSSCDDDTVGHDDRHC